MTAVEKLKEYGLTRYCEWNKVLGACDVGWGCADSNGIKTCSDGSAKENCCNIVRISLENLDEYAINRLRTLGDVA